MRELEDGCRSCGFSRVYCGCVTFIDGKPCCTHCDHRTPATTH